MHHVPADKRAQRSAELVYDALRTCLEEKAFGRITVSDIQRASGVARTTFYRAFGVASDAAGIAADFMDEYADVFSGLAK